MTHPKKYIRGPFHLKISEFIAFRKSLGFAMLNAAYVFNEFDDYLAKNYGKTKIITRSMVVEYLATTKHLHSRSRNYRVILIRGFCRYLYQQDSRNYIPEKRILPNTSHKLVPYIFSDGDITRIIKKIQSGPKRKIISITNSTVVRLLAVTGLRVSEACRLNVSDVDLKSGILHIQRSKFYKSRIVPISKTTISALIYYKQTRMGYFRTTDPLAPFFVGMTGNRIIKESVGRSFRRTVRALKIRGDTGNTWPRVHDLRHTFATRSLENIVQAGSDPQAYLPALATYLGHVNLDYTQTYLHPSIELLRTAGNRFNNYLKSAQTGI